MDSKALMERIGLDLSQEKVVESYTVKAKLSFMGAQNYVLGTKLVDLTLRTGTDGFHMSFAAGLEVKAEQFLGNKIRQTTVHDVLVEFPDMPMPGLSMAKLHPGIYPRVLRDQDTLRVAP